MEKVEPPETRKALKLNIDQSVFEATANEETKILVQEAQAREQVSDGSGWNPKYNLPEPSEFHHFATKVYNTSKKTHEIAPKSLWKLLYQGQGKVFLNLLDGFYGELYFNAENNYMLLVIKGTSSMGDWWSDIKNVGLGLKGGVIDSAFTFGEIVRELILKFNCKPMLLITGHSLGGYLAQLVTYTIMYCYIDEEGKVRSRDKPTDDFGIYTMVFDSPAVFNQIRSIDERNPLVMQRFMLPIVNFVADVNMVNSFSPVGPHLGQVLVIENFDDIGEKGLFGFLRKPFSSHGIKNFEEIDINKWYNVEHLQSRKTVKHNRKEIPSFFFSMKIFELLQKYLFLAPMCAELVDQLPKFKLTNSCILIEDENVSAEEFIPRAHRFLSFYKDQIESGKFNGKQIVDMVIYNLWRADMTEDAHGFCLNEDWKKEILEFEDGTKIGGFESYEEMRFVGCIIHNSMTSHFHYDLKKFETLDSDKVEDFVVTTEATLVLIVEERNVKINHTAQGKVKILYLVLDDKAHGRIELKLSMFDENCRKQLRETKLNFLDNKVSAFDIFGSQLLQELSVWSILNFSMESALKGELFYSDQGIVCKKRYSTFENATYFALELKKGELRFVLISSDAGMGKSTALKQIAKTLQDEQQNYWIVHLNLFDVQTELFDAKNDLMSKEAAVKFIKKNLLTEHKNYEIKKKLFDWKLNEKQMVICLDSLDEICPYYRETADKLIDLLRETEIQIVVTSRPHEGKNLIEATTFELKPLNEWYQKIEFIKKRFEALGKPKPDNIVDWFTKTFGCNKYNIDYFWRIPLNLVMIVYIFSDNLEIKAGSELHKANIYIEFLKKTIDDTLKVKIGIEKTRASNARDYDEKTKKYNGLIEFLAISSIFHEGAVQKEMEEEDGEFINRFVVAKLSKEYKYVSFLHKSYAEHLIARVLVKQLSLENQKSLLDNEQLKSILFDYEKQEIRTHICGILTACPATKITLPSDVIKEEKKELIKLLIKEDRYELYQLLKEQLCCAHDNFVMEDEYGSASIFLLHIALVHARKEFIRDLIKDGAKFENILHEKGVLHYAMKKNLYEQVQCHILSLIIDINTQDYQTKYFPLEYVAKNGNRKMAELLIENGALVDRYHVDDEDHRTALYHAIKTNSSEVVDLLIEKGADSKRALKWALELNCTELFNAICSKTPDNLKEEMLTEALSHAAKEGNLKNCKLLCNDYKANPTDIDLDGETIVHHAAKEGNLECIQYFLENLRSVDVRNREGQTPLMKALQYQRVEVVEWLLDQKADVNAADKSGETCLHYAAAADENKMFVELLVDAGAEIEVKDNRGWTALFYASRHAYENVVRYLLDKKANATVTDKDGNTCLHVASMSSNGLECVKLFVDRLKIAFNCTNHKQETPLHFAAASSKGEEIVAFLLERGADPNIKDANEKTSLHKASEGRNVENMQLLLIKKGADIKTKDKDGKTSLHYAAEKRNIECVELLVNEGVEIDAKDNNGRTALFSASINGNTDVVKYLIENGANAKITDKDGNTCLHLACKHHCLECVQLLLKHHDVNFQNLKKETPLHVAAATHTFENIVGFLLEKGADPKIRNKDDQTSLHLAAKEGRVLKVIEWLFEKAAVTIDDKDTKGRTALFYAIEQRSTDVFNYLLEKGANATLKDNNDTTCLHLACKYTNWKFIKLLLTKMNADITARDKDGKTCLHYAADFCEDLQDCNDTLPCIEFLVMKGQEIDVTDNRGWTPLFYALKRDDRDIVIYLLFKLANADHRDNEGNTCLHIASISNRTNFWNTGFDCVKLFVDRLKVAVNCTNNKKETPLHLASATSNYFRSVNIVAFLLKRGADPNAKSIDEQTSLHYAAQNENVKIVQLLVENGADINLKDTNRETPLAVAERLGKENVAEYLRGQIHRKRINFDVEIE